MVMDDPFRDDPQNILSLRSEIDGHIRSRLHGFYFAASDTILGSKHDDQALWEEICPDDAGRNMVTDTVNYIFRTLIACREKWHILEAEGPLPFWKIVTALGKVDSNVRIRPVKVRDLITALIKARQRYILRQAAMYPGFDMEADMRPASDAAAQQVLECVMRLDDPTTFSGDLLKSPLCSEKEKRDLLKHAVTYGPVRQISGKRFQLGKGAPQNLYPVSDLARRPSITNARGFIGKIADGLQSPKRRIDDTTVPKTAPPKRMSTPSRHHNIELPHTASGGKRKSKYSLFTPTRRRKVITGGDESPLRMKNAGKTMSPSKKRIKTGSSSGSEESADKPVSPKIEKHLKSPFKFQHGG